jgi:2-methylfumaryl-CoA isomerase
MGSSDPVAHVLPAWDCIAGNMAVSALLAAERHRLKTGEGQDVDLSLKDVAAAMLGHLGIIGEVVVNGVDRPKSGNALYGAYGQDFICADGRRIMVIGLTDRQWRGLVKVTGSADAMEGIARQTGLNLSKESARWESRAMITEALIPWFAARTLPEIAPLFEDQGLTWSEFRSFARAVKEDPDLQPGENPMFANIEQPGIGRYPVPASPLTFSAAATPEPAPAPVLGAHTEEVLADVAGLPSGEIAQLFDQGIVAGPR